MPRLHTLVFSCNRLILQSSSAVQILPAIQPKASQITTFVRSPIWILRTISDDPKPYTKAEKREFLKNPDKLTHIRKYNEGVMNSIYCELPLHSLVTTILAHNH